MCLRISLQEGSMKREYVAGPICESETNCVYGSEHSCIHTITWARGEEWGILPVLVEA